MRKPDASPSAAERSVTPQGVGGEIHDSVKVICRVRPFNQREVDLHEQANQALPEWEQFPIRSVVTFDGEQCSFLDPERDYAEREHFAFDQCLWSIPDDVQACATNPFASQAVLFESCGATLLQHAWDGFNTCFFAYGQTGAGKTFSMMGSPSDPGVIPRLGQRLFEQVEQKTREAAGHDSHRTTYQVHVRYLEIYNECVKDLLWSLSPLTPEAKSRINPDNLRVRNMPSGVIIENLTSVLVDSGERLLELIELGNSSRTTAATKMNERSSRSHAIFKLELRQVTTSIPKKQFEKPLEHVRDSVINLVDLAGSERNKKTGAVGDRLKEAANINKSLSTLKAVIDALVDNSTSKGPKKRPPYRDSTLTALLMDSLGGNSRTYMLVCLSPHADNAEETLQTLKYGSRARQIVHTVHVNENAAGRLMLDMEDELARMKAELEAAAAANTEDALAAAEQLRREIDECGRDITQLQEELRMRTEHVDAMRAHGDAIQHTLDTRALAGIRSYVAGRGPRKDAAAEYRRCEAQRRASESERALLSRALNDAEAGVRAATEAIERYRGQQDEDEIALNAARRRTIKLEVGHRDLKRITDEQEKELQRLRVERMHIVLAARVRNARLRLDHRAHMAMLTAQNRTAIALLDDSLARQLQAHKEEAAQAQVAAAAVADALTQELEQAHATARRVEAERHAQIRALEGELEALRNTSVANAADGDARAMQAAADWDARQRRMEERYGDEVTRLRAALDAEATQMLQKEQRRLDVMRTHWEAAVRQAESKSAADYNAATAEAARRRAAIDDAWRPKSAAALGRNDELRRDLRAVDAFEADLAQLARAITITDSEGHLSRSANGEWSPAADALVAALMSFAALHKENALSRYDMAQLLCDDRTNLRCDVAPVVGPTTISNAL